MNQSSHRRDTTSDIPTLASRRSNAPDTTSNPRKPFMFNSKPMSIKNHISNSQPLLSGTSPKSSSSLCLLCRTSSRLLWTGHGRGCEVSRSRPPRGSARTWSPWRPRPWSCTRWSGRRAAPPSPWWRRTSSTCRRRSEGKEGASALVSEGA